MSFFFTRKHLNYFYISFKSKESSLHDEVNLKVLKSIADINGSESVRGKSVEELVARPLERADHDRLAALIQLEGPRAARLVICGRFEEAFVEWGGREVKLGALLLILHISEMQVAVKAHTVGDR